VKKILETFLYSIALAGLMLDSNPAGYRMIKDLEFRNPRPYISDGAISSYK